MTVETLTPCLTLTTSSLTLPICASWSTERIYSEGPMPGKSSELLMSPVVALDIGVVVFSGFSFKQVA